LQNLALISIKTEKTIDILLITCSIGVLISYTILTIIFDYPNILRQETGMILTKFHEGVKEQFGYGGLLP
jgi:hypothetical protein